MAVADRHGLPVSICIRLVGSDLRAWHLSWMDYGKPEVSRAVKF
jgi:hypothetical protein